METRVGLFLPSLTVTAAPGAPLGLVHDCGAQAWGGRAACEPRRRDPGWFPPSPAPQQPSTRASVESAGLPPGPCPPWPWPPCVIAGLPGRAPRHTWGCAGPAPLGRQRAPCSTPLGSAGSRGSACHGTRQPCCIPKTCGCSPRRAGEPQTQSRARIVSRSFIA